MHSSKYVAFGFLTGTLLVGAALGYAADRAMVKSRLCTAAPPNERSWRQVVYEDLALSVEQRGRLDTLLDERRRAISALNATIRPRVDSIHDDYRSDVQAILTPVQRDRLAERLKELQQSRLQREQAERARLERERGNPGKDRP